MSEAQVRDVTICNARGLHARAAAKFVETARSFDAVIEVSRDDETVSADSIMELLMLAAGKGSQIRIQTSGQEADKAADSLVELVEAGFHEAE